METAMLIVALILLICLVIGLSRIALGPTIADGILALQFTSTVGIGLLPVLGVIWSIPSLIDIALVLAVLGVPTTLAFSRLDAPPQEKGEH
jgi:multicomponent Na+:H+ antiporter subunit F